MHTCPASPPGEATKGKVDVLRRRRGKGGSGVRRAGTNPTHDLPAPRQPHRRAAPKGMEAGVARPAASGGRVARDEGRFVGRRPQVAVTRGATRKG